MIKQPSQTAQLTRISVLLLCAVIVTAQTNRTRNGHVVFRCGVVIDPASGTSIKDAVIETNGGKILRVGKDNNSSMPPDASIEDFRDKYVIPGLVDTHGHLYARTGSVWNRTDPLLPIFYLAAGVTTIGDPGSLDPEGDIALRNRIDSGQYPGPRYFLAGEYIDMPPLSVGWMNASTTPEEARLRIRMWAMQGTTAIKLYASVKGDLMRAAIEEAHQHSMRVWGHVTAVTFQEAIDMGVDQLFHGVIAMADTRPSGMSYEHLDKWILSNGAIDLTRPEIQKLFQSAAERRVVLTPTAVVSEIVEPGTFEKHHLAEQEPYYTPAAWARVQKILQGPPPDIYPLEAMRSELSKNKQFIRMAHDAGCLLSTGTDYVLLTMLPGWSLRREMEIFSEAGLVPMEILKAATWNGVYAIGRTDQLGSLEAGKLADFVALDADPLADIRNVAKVYRVVKAGEIYNPADLLKRVMGSVN